ncbi:mitochondrial nicotinamide adenine dinucleotide transporter SLC25A51-like [Oncorhynchus nerka]|uniref:mitochondrial nicotinamide adenine dinucleotide transporter SLC25A51-like n=1 Tax=Oncorhynchus nerka TaxID=8023 RepID=UPI0011301766|nr:solute carrier family 25 member 51-like [Oncorhynchus nerka]XP_029517738.1 solute carrier family 25 member 51-like [Oncorhynchus nerka]XP_035619095.1 mitochondrial nicotinamide adenine dinucleotide transporter SLC25A51-like [Oncorhynchus keta]XP_035619102.1 mitochondrial nicotinamide adenine dinucleotide transporter SLC25A51-like [Oncorhynchus keta]
MAITTMDPESACTSQPQGSLGKGGGSLLSGRGLGAALGPRGKHYVCGSIAAFTNIVVTFPIQKVLFRQQLHGVLAREAVRQLQRDGMRKLYRGLLPPLLQKTTTVAIMFGLYEDFSRVLLDQVPSGSGIPELVTRSFAAALAGTAEAVLTPFERVQTLLQDHRHHGRFQNTAHTFRTLLSEYGVKECYRGLVPVLIRNGPSNVLFFGFRGPIKEQLPEASSRAGHLINDFVCGGMLGAALGIMFYPLNVVKSRAQSQVGGAFRPCGEVLMTVWRERGGSVAMLFRGAHLNYHRSLLSWGIINATYELLLSVLILKGS